MENMDQKSLYYLENAPVPKTIMHMVMPMMLSFIVTLIYNITDAFYISKLDDTAMMAAITLALPFSVILMALFWSSILMGVIFMAICLPLLSPILQLLGARDETLLHTRN